MTLKILDMKKKLGLILFVGLFTLCFTNIGHTSPCSTGYSSVSSSWWWPSNDTYYTLCGCQVIKGYDASGGCTSGGEGNGDQQ